jgi:hypothetical protein
MLPYMFVIVRQIRNIHALHLPLTTGPDVAEFYVMDSLPGFHKPS